MICLVMIVRNEEHIIEKCLESVYCFISHWIICDTGSTDNTILIIKNFFKEKGISGDVYSDTWVDFSTNRNLSLQRAQHKGKYMWIMDADDILVGDFPVVNIEKAEAYFLKFKSENNVTYSRPALLSTSIEWSYVGVVHETPVSAQKITIKPLHGDYYIMSRRLGSRNKNQNKYLDDAILLIKFLDEGSPLFSRNIFLIAQSYYDAFIFDKALEWYEKSVYQNENQNDFKYISLLRIGHCYAFLNESIEKIENAYLKAFEYMPKRVESLYYLGLYLKTLYIENNSNTLALEKSFQYFKKGWVPQITDPYVLYLETDIYNWKYYMHFAHTCVLLNKKDIFQNIHKHMINNDILIKFPQAGQHMQFLLHSIFLD